MRGRGTNGASQPGQLTGLDRPAAQHGQGPGHGGQTGRAGDGGGEAELSAALPRPVYTRQGSAAPLEANWPGCGQPPSSGDKRLRSGATWPQTF